MSLSILFKYYINRSSNMADDHSMPVYDDTQSDHNNQEYKGVNEDSRSNQYMINNYVKPSRHVGELDIEVSRNEEHSSSFMECIISSTTRTRYDQTIKSLGFLHMDKLQYLPFFTKMPKLTINILKRYKFISKMYNVYDIVKRELPEINNVNGLECTEMELICDIKAYLLKCKKENIDIDITFHDIIVSKIVHMFPYLKGVTKYDALCHIIQMMTEYTMMYDNVSQSYIIYDAQSGLWKVLDETEFKSYLSNSISTFLPYFSSYVNDDNIHNNIDIIQNVLSNPHDKNLMYSLQKNYYTNNVNKLFDLNDVLHFTDGIYDLEQKTFTNTFNQSYMVTKTTGHYYNLLSAFNLDEVCDYERFSRGTPKFNSVDLDYDDLIDYNRKITDNRDDKIQKAYSHNNVFWIIDELKKDIPEKAEFIDDFKHFLKTVHPNPAILVYWLRVCASCLNRKNKEKILIVWQGIGNNAKTILSVILLKCLGLYSTTIDSSVLTRSKPHPDKPSPSSITMDRMSLVVTSEPSDKTPLKVDTVKFMTGCEPPVLVRGLFEKKNTERHVQPKVLVCTNSRLNCSEGVDQALISRFIVIPFQSSFYYHVKQEVVYYKDGDVTKPFKYRYPINRKYGDEKFINEASILMLHLLLKIHKIDPGPHVDQPIEIVQATKDFINQSDPVALFKNTKLLLTENEKDIISLEDMHVRFNNWYKTMYAGSKAISIVTFTSRLEKLAVSVDGGHASMVKYNESDRDSYVDNDYEFKDPYVVYNNRNNANDYNDNANDYNNNTNNSNDYNYTDPMFSPYNDPNDDNDRFNTEIGSSQENYSYRNYMKKIKDDNNKGNHNIDDNEDDMLLKKFISSPTYIASH